MVICIWITYCRCYRGPPSHIIKRNNIIILSLLKYLKRRRLLLCVSSDTAPLRILQRDPAEIFNTDKYLFDYHFVILSGNLVLTLLILCPFASHRHRTTTTMNAVLKPQIRSLLYYHWLTTIFVVAHSSINNRSSSYAQVVHSTRWFKLLIENN